MTTTQLLKVLLACSAVTWIGFAVAILLWRGDLAVWSMQATFAVSAFAVIGWGIALAIKIDSREKKIRW